MSPLLKKSFDSAKCKTLLQLTAQKLKILRNKHGLAVKSLRADVARLLENGRDSSAKTQVDNVFREEKIVALYNLLEHFCQLVINRLENIKSQRECPSDLKEAVASLIYAASRCGEIEELKKVSSYLTNKYGTEFSLAAKELRSGCGVNTQVIQNLSSLPLSSDARMKLLKDVAVENKIHWNYDTTIADTSKQSADSLDEPRPTSETQASNMSSVERQKPAFLSMHVNEVNGRASGVLKTAFSSQTLSPNISLDSPLHNMHQPPKINTNLETKEICSSSRAKNTLDPYTLAKSQGRMDYKFVSDYKGREHISEEHLNSTNSIKVTQPDGRSRSPGSSKMLHKKQMSTAGKQEVEIDPYALAKSQGRMDYKFVSDDKGREHIIEEHLISTNSMKVTQPDGQSRSPGSSKMLHKKQMSTAGRQEAEMQLLELEAVAKIALESASEAAVAARAAVAMVRKESLGRIETCRLENTKTPEGRHSESSSVPIFYESSSGPIRNVLRFSPSSDNSGSDLILNNYASEDIDEDRFKYVVFEQTSGSQRSLQTQDSAKPDTMISEREESRSTEVPTSPSIDSFYSTDAKEDEVDWKTSHGQKQEGFIKMKIQQAKTVQNISSVPQFDDYSSEEALEEDTLFYPSENASSKQQHENLFGVVEVQSDKYIQKECLVPQFDDDISEEASEEETPFYLKGRAAMVKEDYADGMARVPSSKLMSASSLTDDRTEESSSSNLKGTKEEVNLHVDCQEEPLDSSTNADELAFMEERSVHSLEFTGSACSPSKSLKTYSKSEIDAVNGGSGIGSSYLDSRDDNLPSPLSSVRSFSPTGGLADYEDENPSSQVRRNLKWCSTISENSEFASERSIESHAPSSLEDSSSQSPNLSFGLENGPRAFKPDFELPTQGVESLPTKYKGMSRRSVRSSKPRQTQNNPSQ